MVNLKVVKNDSCKLGQATVIPYAIVPPKRFQCRHSHLIGIDPGQVNMGFAVWFRNQPFLTAWQIKLPSQKLMVDRILAVEFVIEELMVDFPKGDSTLKPGEDYIALIEYAAHAFGFGQVPLSEARTAAVQSLLNFGIPSQSIHTPAPTSVYKAVFGSGKIKSKDAWHGLLGPDAASAVGCLLSYGSLYGNKKSE